MARRALIDADILLYEIGFSGQLKDKDTGELHVSSWEEVEHFLEKKIEVICTEAEAEEPPLFFLTNTKRINKMLNKQRKREEIPPKEFTPNFREAIAVQKEYKAGRVQEKPKHFYNILTHILHNYDCVVNEDGLEADDAMCIYQLDHAKKHGVKVPFHAGHFILDYEDYMKYQGITFIMDNKGYVISDTGKGPTRKVWSLHREIMGNPKDKVVDHINGNKLDNRKCNLRICTTRENACNSISTKGSSKYKGVHWDEDRKKWTACIKNHRKHHFIGRFDNEEDAAKAYDDLAIKLHGEYARLNFHVETVPEFCDTIICSRDKDLRQCPFWHYSWEVAKQPSIGPLFVEPLGVLEKVNEGEKFANGKPKPLKLFGTGHKFFYSQLLMGDRVDNIGGVVGRGPAFAYKLLHEARSERELYELVAELYVKTYGDDWKVRMKEQADLLWMVRELDEKGDKVLWKPPPRT